MQSMDVPGLVRNLGEAQLAVRFRRTPAGASGKKTLGAFGERSLVVGSGLRLADDYRLRQAGGDDTIHVRVLNARADIVYDMDMRGGNQRAHAA